MIKKSRMFYINIRRRYWSFNFWFCDWTINGFGLCRFYWFCNRSCRLKWLFNCFNNFFNWIYNSHYCFNWNSLCLSWSFYRFICFFLLFYFFRLNFFFLFILDWFNLFLNFNFISRSFFHRSLFFLFLI